MRRSVAAPGSSVDLTNPDPPERCWGNVKIRSTANGKYVAAEKGFSGKDYQMLRARTDPSQVGTWELFRVCRNRDTWHTTIMSYDSNPSIPNGLIWVGATTFEQGTRRGLLKAFMLEGWVNTIDPYFTTLTEPTGTGGNSTWFYSLATGLYVSAQFDYSGTEYASLRARLGSVGPWESFTW
ncbi:hypothetical protein [Dactylosporangium sp. CA-139066]|uniref:hypothetical protein n=1 Tax=Dactylosporangium sp. CA-139066 TaxID=3239930 RepID=UPI003D905210